MRALALVDAWPVRSVAAGALAPDGTRAVRGDAAKRFALASVTKPLVAYAVLVAVEEGIVGLDDPAGPSGSTLRHLLAHASGLAFDAPIVLAPPGTRRIYSNAGFDALGAVIEQAAGMTLADYLSEAVLEPLAMTATALDGSPAADATGSLDDLLRFATELRQPRLIHPDTLAAATAVAFPGLAGVLPGFGHQDANDWGLGFERRDDKRPHWTGALNSPETFGHFGGSGTLLWLDPRAGVALVVLTDEPFGPWAASAWPSLSDAVLAEAAPR